MVKRVSHDLIEALDIPGPEIDTIHRAHRKAGHESHVSGHDESWRSGEQVDAQAKRVAKVRWSKKQQYQIGSIGDAPGMERLPDITRLFREALSGRQIEHARNARRRVDEKTRERDTRGIGAPLQQ